MEDPSEGKVPKWDVPTAEEMMSMVLKNSTQIEILMSIVMTFAGIVCFFILVYVPAPYGRYAEGASRLFGPGVPVRLAWLIQESPAFFLPVVTLACLNQFTSLPIPAVTLPNVILLGMFLLHYFQRSFIYPMLIKHGKPTPFVPFSLAFLFCSYNGLMQLLSLVYGRQNPDSYTTSARFLVGSALYVVGMVVNIHSDRILRNLRGPGETGYKIPRGGAFELVTAANYFGETVEWIGYAVAAATPAAAAFAAFTVLNLAPRALSHHQWKALGYRIDPAHWGSWDYFKLMLRRWMDGFAETAATSNVMSPLLARFLLPVHGSRQKGVIQVWASREKVEDAWELERMELKFSPRDSPAFNINANNLGLEDVAKVRDDQNDRINAVDDDLSTWDHSTDLPRMATLMNREIETILIWVDSGTPPRSQLEDPSVDVATLPDLDDPWKLALEDIEEPVEYITEE